MHRRRALLQIGSGPLVLACQRGGTPAGTTLPRSRAHVFASVATTDGQDARLVRVFPTLHMAALDPFVLLDDFHVAPPAGFPMHPHRGFEAFTYMVGGAFHHKDNLGNDSVIHAGGTQRFTSGAGAWHSEMPASAGENSGLQLWVNLPRRLKKMDPSYGGIGGDAIPEVKDGGLRVRPVVGEHHGARSPVALQTTVKYLDVACERAAALAQWIETGWEALVYVIAGRVRVGDAVVAARHAARLGPGLADLMGDAGSRFVFLSGRPHHEPIVHRGPFVD